MRGNSKCLRAFSPRSARGFPSSSAPGETYLRRKTTKFYEMFSYSTWPSGQMFLHSKFIIIVFLKKSQIMILKRYSRGKKNHTEWLGTLWRKGENQNSNEQNFWGALLQSIPLALGTRSVKNISMLLCRVSNCYNTSLCKHLLQLKIHFIINVEIYLQFHIKPTGCCPPNLSYVMKPKTVTP